MNFVVVKQGVYMQGIYGPYDSVEAAKWEARKRAEEDEDHYHTWEVRELTPEGLITTSWPSEEGSTEVLVRYAQEPGEGRRASHPEGTIEVKREEK